MSKYRIMDSDTSPEDNRNDSDDSSLPEHLQRGLNTLLSQRYAVRSYLRERGREFVAGRHGTVHDELRQWSEYEPALFSVVALTLQGPEQFAEDVHSEFGDEALELLAELQREFAGLRAPLCKVRSEEMYGLYNDPIIPELRDTALGDSDGVPVMSVKLRSGGEALTDCQIRPSSALQCGAILLQQAVHVMSERSCDREDLHGGERAAQDRVIHELGKIVEELPEPDESEQVTGEDAKQIHMASDSLPERSSVYADRLSEDEREATSYIQ
jgi:hypothetical protein